MTNLRSNLKNIFKIEHEQGEISYYLDSDYTTLHRLDGPAQVYGESEVYWSLFGTEVSEKHVEQFVNRYLQLINLDEFPYAILKEIHASYFTQEGSLV